MGSLVWGVKQSFCGYVRSAGGSMATEDGAEALEDGTFRFASGSGEGLSLDAEGRPTGRGAFQGLLRFEAHGGMLKVCLADPVVEIGPEGAVLTVCDHPARDRRIEVARLELDGMSREADGSLVIPTTLSMWGIQLLGDHYPLRTPLDPVRLRLE